MFLNGSKKEAEFQVFSLISPLPPVEFVSLVCPGRRFEHGAQIFLNRSKQKKQSFRFFLCYLCSLLLNLTAHCFAPGRISRCTPSVTFSSWKLMSKPSGTSSSFM